MICTEKQCTRSGGKQPPRRLSLASSPKGVLVLHVEPKDICQHQTLEALPLVTQNRRTRPRCRSSTRDSRTTRQPLQPTVASHLPSPGHCSHFEAQRLKCASAVASAFLRRATACFSRASTDRDKFTSTCESQAQHRERVLTSLSSRAAPKCTKNKANRNQMGKTPSCDWERTPGGRRWRESVLLL